MGDLRKAVDRLNRAAANNTTRAQDGSRIRYRVDISLMPFDATADDKLRWTWVSAPRGQLTVEGIHEVAAFLEGRSQRALNG